MSRYVLDTDTCIYWLKGNKLIEKKIVNAGLENVCITIITECELFYGAFKSSKAERNLQVIDELRGKTTTIHTRPDVAPVFGKKKADLERIGRPLDDADLLIACLALVTGATLVTNNTRHFSRISGLKLENW